MTLDRGTLLNNRYRIVEILGQGGMAAVYRAIDENLGVDVAVKENLFTTEEYARQFRFEAVILANLRHPNLPRVTDHFVIDEQGQYLVMDYIEGEDLRQRMDRLGTIPEEEVIVIGVALCEALSYMHTQVPPVLHRDIKPGNVKITPKGEIFLVDFGLAKVLQSGQATTTGARAMTPGYSPPEQYGTARTDARTDVYSLGATLYSALTDHLPEDALARAMDQTELTPVRQHNSKISRRLALTIEKALAVRPDDRFQTADEFRKNLFTARSTTRQKLPVDLFISPPPIYEEDLEPKSVESAADGDDGEQRASSQPRLSTSGARVYQARNLRRNWRVSFLLFSFFAVGFAAFLFGFPWLVENDFFGAASTSTPTATIPRQNLLLTNPTNSTKTAHSPTPSEAVLAPSQTPKPSATRRPVATNTSPSALTTAPLGGGPGQIAFTSEKSGVPEIYIMNIDGTGELFQVTNIPEGACQPDWSPDGNRLVFTSPCSSNQDVYRGSSLYIINADGTGLTPLPSLPGGDFDPKWSPDGKKVAFTSVRSEGLLQIYILDVVSGNTELLADPDGKANSQPNWSPDGKKIVYVGPRGQVYSMSANGSDRVLLSKDTGSLRSKYPVWSPDGSTIVFTQWAEGTSGYPWLMKVQSTGSTAVRSTKDDSPMTEADYSPDGNWIVFVSWPNSPNRDIYMMMMPGGIERRQITYDEANEYDPVWRPIPTQVRNIP